MHHGIRPTVVWMVLATLLLAPAGCEQAQEVVEARPEKVYDPHQDLLMGYDLLHSTLDGEGQLRLLKIFRKITRSGPVEEVSEAMDTLASASKKRSNELKRLRKLAPDVSAAPEFRSPVGDAINAVATEIGKEEMMDRGGHFDVRFVLLQTQATRMVAAIARACAQHETNAVRKKWLLEVANEYEAYRDDLIEIIRTYVAGKGAAQRSG